MQKVTYRIFVKVPVVKEITINDDEKPKEYFMDALNEAVNDIQSKLNRDDCTADLESWEVN